MKKQKMKKGMKGLQKASKNHTAQAKTLKGVLNGGHKKRNKKKQETKGKQSVQK